MTNPRSPHPKDGRRWEVGKREKPTTARVIRRQGRRLSWLAQRGIDAVAGRRGATRAE